MANFAELLSRVDMTLGEPHPSYPSQPQRWEALRGNAQLLFNINANTPVSWSVSSFILTVTAATSTYALPVSDFGKDILIETYTGDPYHQPAVIARCSLQSLLLGNFPTPNTDATAHSAMAIAIYREGGSVYARVEPPPQETARYKVWYELDSVDMDATTNTMALPHGDTYLVTMAALQLLPLTKWAGLDEDGNRRKRQELAQVLRPLAALQEREYRLHVATDRDAGRVVSQGFDDDSYAYDY